MTSNERFRRVTKNYCASDWTWYVFYILGCILSFGLLWFFRNFLTYSIKWSKE